MSEDIRKYRAADIGIVIFDRRYGCQDIQEIGDVRKQVCLSVSGLMGEPLNRLARLLQFFLTLRLQDVADQEGERNDAAGHQQDKPEPQAAQSVQYIPKAIVSASELESHQPGFPGSVYPKV